jgi:hypothetical protein
MDRRTDFLSLGLSLRSLLQRIVIALLLRMQDGLVRRGGNTGSGSRLHFLKPRRAKKKKKRSKRPSGEFHRQRE